jgi:hypothetical protein
MGSDHASLLIEVPLSISHSPPSSIIRWKIDPQFKDDWIKRFQSLPTPIPSDEELLRLIANQFLTNITLITDDLFSKRKPPSKRSFPWWNEDCRIAVNNLKGYRGEERKIRNEQLRITIKDAKKMWINNLLTDPDTNIWDLARWQKSCRQNWIPPIQTQNGISSDQSLMPSRKSVEVPRIKLKV